MYLDLMPAKPRMQLLEAAVDNKAARQHLPPHAFPASSAQPGHKHLDHELPVLRPAPLEEDCMAQLDACMGTGQCNYSL